MTEYGPAERHTARLVRLNDLALLLIEGADAISFLQGQVTCDVKGLPEGQATLGALCNPKGRAIAVFRLFRHHARCYLIVRADMIGAVRSRLQRYVLRSQVSITDARDHWSALGLLGALNEPFIKNLGLPTPLAVGQVALTSRGAVILSLDRDDKFLLLAPNELAADVETAWVEHKWAVCGSPVEWERADIHHGVPTVTPATTEEFIPQMLNLDLLGGISFNKGCYTGQEVIARTHYLGTVKRRMYRFRVCCDRIPEAGARLAGERDEHAIGHVVTAVAVDESCYEMLAVVIDDDLDSGPVRLWSSSGPRLERVALPYLDAVSARENSTA